MKASWFTEYSARRIPIDHGGYSELGHYYGIGQAVWQVYFVFEGNDYTETVRADNETAAIDLCKAINRERSHAP